MVYFTSDSTYIFPHLDFGLSKFIHAGSSGVLLWNREVCGLRRKIFRIRSVVIDSVEKILCWIFGMWKRGREALKVSGAGCPPLRRAICPPLTAAEYMSC